MGYIVPGISILYSILSHKQELSMVFKKNIPFPPSVLRSMDIIPRIQNLFGTGIFRNADLMQEFKITKQNASIRLRRLNFWGYIKFADIKKRGYGGYVLTELGKKYPQKEK